MAFGSCVIHGSVMARISRSLARICLSKSILRMREAPARAGTLPVMVALAALAHWFSRVSRPSQSLERAATTILLVIPAIFSYIERTSLEVMSTPVTSEWITACPD
ncbi:hypothetical protein D3C81_1552450 [compost metagenome]